MIKYAAVLLSDVDRFRYCPYCGSDIVEVYPGDYHGFTTCMNEACDDSFDFTLLQKVDQHLFKGRLD